MRALGAQAPHSPDMEIDVAAPDLDQEESWTERLEHTEWCLAFTPQRCPPSLPAAQHDSVTRPARDGQMRVGDVHAAPIGFG